MKLVHLFQNYESLFGTEISVNGWVKTCRNQKQMIFIHISDGSMQQTLQIIASPEHIVNMEELSLITTGTSLFARGILIKSPAKGQQFELSAREIKIYQICPSTFPFQKVGLPLEFMRKFPHLRHRSNIVRAVFAVKSCIMKSMHDFFEQQSFHHVDLPILTTNACESGCQPLQVTSLLNDGKISSIPTKTFKKEVFVHDKITQIIGGGTRTTVNVPTDEIDFSKDFFDNPVYLTVSNQLHLECFAHGLGYVYTITQATRGEPSQTTKHLATFNMLEAEFCFGSLDDNINLAESLIKYCVSKVITECTEELNLLDRHNENKLLSKLHKIVDERFIRISHYHAIKLLKESHLKDSFINEPKFTDDLSGEHERFLVKHFDNPVVVTNYPKAVKAFYMPVTKKIIDSDVTIEYVDCFDILMDIGEVVGGSQRIWNEGELIERMEELELDLKHLDWYVELRKYGSVPHGGFGLGIERLVATLTGMQNIKDCISFPISIHECTH